MRNTETETGSLPTGFIGDQGFQSEPAQKNAYRRTHFDDPPVDVETGAAQREPGQQRQSRIAAEGEWQAFVHSSSL